PTRRSSDLSAAAPATWRTKRSGEVSVKGSSCSGSESRCHETVTKPLQSASPSGAGHATVIDRAATGAADGGMAFTLRQLQFFVAVAEAGSVSGAARALSISQSSVTEAIQSLEADLGVTLFDRRARGLDLTHKGSLFLRHATQILGDVSNARMAFQDDAREAAGRLSVGVTSLVAGHVLADVLCRFLRACPQVVLSAIEDTGGYLQLLLVGGELDVAVMLTSSIRDRAEMYVESLLVSPYRL